MAMISPTGHRVSVCEVSTIFLRLFQSIKHRLWLVFLRNRLRESTLANRLHAFAFASWAWLQSDSTYVIIDIRRRNLFSRNIALRGRVHLYVDRHRHDSLFGMRGCELYVVRSEQYYKKRVMKFFHNSLRFVCRCRRHLFCLFLIGLLFCQAPCLFYQRVRRSLRLLWGLG